MTQVEVDEVLGLVRHEAAKIAPHDAVPGCALAIVELGNGQLSVSSAACESSRAALTSFLICCAISCMDDSTISSDVRDGVSLTRSTVRFAIASVAACC